jgi:tRNA(Ile)-lysidine synthase
MSIEVRARELLSQAGLTGRHRLVVAVSGGPDSLALLHLLSRRELHPAANLVVGHLNHQLRPSAAADATFVAETAAAWGLECHTESVDVAGLARRDGLSLEEAGRGARYQFLARLAHAVGAAHVAAGHNADDQAETVLMHFLRGAGLSGLRGMRPAGPLPGDPAITLLRPFLTTGRAEIEAYCQEHGLAPLTDASNTDTTYFRNRLRHELLPYLAGYNPVIRERLLHLAETAAADYDLLASQRLAAWPALVLDQGPGWLVLDLRRWQAMPLSLRRSTLRDTVWQLDPELRDVGFRTIEQARQVAESGQTGSRATLPGEISLRVEYGRLWLQAPEGRPPVDWPQLPDGEPRLLPVPGHLDLAGGWRLSATWARDIDLDSILANPDPWLAHVAWPAGAALVVRPRRPGERFQPLGLAGRSASVKEFMINRKIPAALRGHWPIVAGADHLLWLAGHALDERVRVGPASPSVVRLVLERVPG